MTPSWLAISTVVGVLMFLIGLTFGATSMSHLQNQESRRIASRLWRAIDAHKWGSMGVWTEADKQLYAKADVYEHDLRRIDKTALINALYHLPGWRQRNRRKVLRLLQRSGGPWSGVRSAFLVTPRRSTRKRSGSR